MMRRYILSACNITSQTASQLPAVARWKTLNQLNEDVSFHKLLKNINT